MAVTWMGNSNKKVYCINTNEIPNDSMFSKNTVAMITIDHFTVLER